MDPAPSVSVVILNWNGLRWIEDCLRSLQASVFTDFETLVVDNGSTDGSADLVREKFGDAVRVVQLDENLGYGAGNNAGIAAARGETIALLNNDTEVDPRWLGEMVAALEKDEKIGMVASKVLSYDDRSVIDNVGHLLYPDGLNRGRGRLERDNGQYDAETEALFPSGCAALYRRAMLDDVGLFDEDFFAYGDDADLGLRGRLAGWTCALAPAAVVYHRYSATAGAYSPLKAYYVERNRIFVALKILPIGMLLLSPLHSAIRYVHQAYGALCGRGAAGQYTRERSALSLVAVLVRAWLGALQGAPRMLKHRWAFRAKRRLTSQETRALFRRFRIGAREIALKD